MELFLETGCQIYHHCDGLGRKFSYACPNATLFQQRMLICDHWYMVNCSKSESNYGANLLIGQRDKPFVSESEHNLRTPRPDLITDGSSFKNKQNSPPLQNRIADINRSKSSNRKAELLETSASSHGRLPWQQQIIEATINHFESTTPLESLDQDFTEKNNDRRDVTESSKSDESNESKKQLKMKPPPLTYQPPKLLPENNLEFRKQEEERLRRLKLISTSKSQEKTQQNRKAPVQTQTQLRPPVQQQQAKQQSRTASQPSPVQKNQNRQQPQKAQQLSFATTSSTLSTNKRRTTFDPDKNFKAFEHFTSPGKTATHQDYDFSRYFSSPGSGSTAAPQRRADNFSFPKIVTTTRKPISFAPFPTTDRPLTAKATPIPQKSVEKVQQAQRSQASLIPKLHTELLPPIENDPFLLVKPIAQPQKSQAKVSQQVQTVKLQQQKTSQQVKSIQQQLKPIQQQQVKAVQQQPQAVKQFSKSVQQQPVRISQQQSSKPTATTPKVTTQQAQRTQQIQRQQSQKTQPQKPAQIQKIQPIKPQINLLPPLFPSSPEKVSSVEKLPLLANKNRIVPQLSTNLLPPLETAARPLEDTTQGPPIYYEWKIPASGLEPPKFDNETNSVRSNSIGHTRRSVQGEANFGENNEVQGSQKKSTVLKSNIVAFPYKTLQRQFSIPDFEFPIEPTGREGYDKEAVNSFQVKIPLLKNERTYFLENPKCPPECHPQYFKPGTCEPCVRIR